MAPPCVFITGQHINKLSQIGNIPVSFLKHMLISQAIVTHLIDHFSFTVTSGRPQGSNFGLRSCIFRMNIITNF